MGAATPVAAHLEMMRFDPAVRPILDLKIPEHIFLDRGLDVVVDGLEDAFCSFRGKMNFVVHVVGVEGEVVERNEGRYDRVGGSPHLRAEETHLVSFRSVGCSVDGGVDDEYGLRLRVWP